MNKNPRIDIYFDLICPWCLIGKRSLDAALAALAVSHPEIRPQLRWHGLPLLPDIPAAGVDYRSFYERRLGSPEAVTVRRAQVSAAAERAGVEIDFEAIRIMPNTLAAHDLIARLDDPEQQTRLIEALFIAYFQQGRNIGDPAELGSIAEEQHCLSSKANRTTRMETSINAVTGVPYYVIDDRLALSGAQPPERISAAILDCLATDCWNGTLGVP